MPYTAEKPGSAPSAEQLRARIPGWGADLDPADRPSVPREQPGIVTGAHWEIPEQQVETGTRERSVEHLRLTPVFGTAQPLRGAAGAIRRVAYQRYSEGQTAHWLLLILGDRVETTIARAQSFTDLEPDNPIKETGILGERGRHPVSSRWGRGRGRVDLKHVWMDPILAVGPSVVVASLVVWSLRRLSQAPGRG